MIKKIYLLCGCPGSGKSTYAKAHIDDKTAWISRDKVRFSMVSEDEEYFSKEKEVFNTFIKEIKKAIKNDLIENIYNTEKIMKEIIHATGIINDNITHLSATSEEVVASSEEGVRMSEISIENLQAVNNSFTEIYELAKNLENA